MDRSQFIGRRWVLARIGRWCAADTARPLLLIGPPGSGKTTIVRRLDEYRSGLPSDHPDLTDDTFVHVHYCQVGHDGTLNPFRFVERLATVLASRYEPFALALAQDTRPDVVVQASLEVGEVTQSEVRNVAIEKLVLAERSIRIAYDRAVRRPLEALRSAGVTEPIRIVVDALDEALTFDRHEHLVELLRHALGTASDPLERLHFLFTVRSGERRVIDRIDAELVDLAATASDDDVREYVRAEAAKRFADVPAPRLGRLIAAIADASDGNFLYAYHALAELDPHTDALQLPTGLSGLYGAFIRRELRPDPLDETWLRSHRPILAMLAAARGSGLTVDMLVSATSLSVAEVTRTLGLCAQYLGRTASPEDSIDFYHPSFREFLLRETDLGIADEQPDLRLSELLTREYATEPDGSVAHYAVAHLIHHLVRALSTSRLSSQREACQRGLRELVDDAAFLERNAGTVGIDATLADLRLAAAQHASFAVQESAVDRAAAHLRDWRTESEPILFAQQLLDAASQVGAASLAESARRRLNTLGRPYLARRWDSEKDPPELVRRLIGHQFGVAALVVLPGGRIASGSYDGTVRVWDHVTGFPIRTIPLYGDRPPGPHEAVTAVRSLTVTPDARLVAGTSAGELVLLDPDSGNIEHRWGGHEPRQAGWPSESVVTSMVVSTDGLLLSAGMDAKVRVWALDEPGSEPLVYDGHDQPVEALCLTPGGTVVSGDAGGEVRHWRPSATPEAEVIARLPVGVHALAATGQHIACGCQDGTIRLLSIALPGDETVLRGHRGPVRALAFLPGYLASASDDCSVRLWDPASGACERMLTGHEGFVQALAVLGDSVLASAESQDVIHIWDLAQTPAEEVREPFGVIYGLSVAGDRALGACADGRVRVWDIHSGRLAAALSGHDGAVRAVTVAAGGQFVSAGDDATLRVWDSKSTLPERVIDAHRGKIRQLVTAPDGRVLSGSEDGVAITDVQSGVTEWVFVGSLPPGILTLAVNASGWIVAGEDRGRHKLRNLFTSEERYIRPGSDGFFNATVRNAVLTADNRLISDGGLMSDEEDLLWVWDIASGRHLGTIAGHTAELFAMGLDGLGRLWTASRDRSVRVIDVDTGVVLTRLRLDRTPVSISPLSDGTGVLIGDMGGRVSRWDLITESGGLTHPRTDLASAHALQQQPLADTALARARTRLQTEASNPKARFAEAAQRACDGAYEAALEELLTAVREESGEGREQARVLMLSVFELMQPGDPLVQRCRRALATALF